MAAVDLKKIIQEMVVPELHEIKTKVFTIEVEIKRLDEKIDSMRSEFTSRFVSLQREVSMAIDIHERLAAIEAKVGI